MYDDIVSNVRRNLHYLDMSIFDHILSGSDTMIYYFSGTGNSHYVAEVLSKSLQDTIQSIESAQSIQQDKIIGIVTPVYFFGLPDIVKDFLERLSVSSKSYLYLVVTYGGKPGNIGKEANKIMQKKGVERHFI